MDASSSRAMRRSSSRASFEFDHQLTLLGICSGAAAAIFVGFAAYDYFGDRLRTAGSIAGFSLLAISAAAGLLFYRLGRPTAGWVVLISMLFCTETTIAWFNGGLGASSLVFYFPMAAAVAVVLGGRAAVAFAACCMVALGVLSWAEVSQLLPTPPFALSSARRGVTYAVAVGVLALIMWYHNAYEATRSDALRRASEQFQTIFDSSETPSVLARLSDRTFVDCNTAFCKLFGHSREDVIGRTSVDLKLFRDLADRDREFAAVLATGRVLNTELDMVTALGDIRRVLRSLTAIDMSGEAMVLVQVIDITERKQAEDELRANRRLLEVVIDAIPMSIFAKDRQSNYVMVNKHMADFLALSKEEFLKRHTSNLPTPPESRQKSLRDDEWVFTNRAVLDQPLAMLQRPDGVFVPFHSIKLPLFDDGGELIGLLGVNRDITEEQHAADQLRAVQRALEDANATLEKTVEQRTAELRRANTELGGTLENLVASQAALVRSEKLAALGRLVAGVAHELNTPIGNSLLSASALADRTNDYAREVSHPGGTATPASMFIEDTQEASQILLRNLEKAGEIIRSFKQVAVDQASSQRRSFALHEIVDEVLLAHRPMLRSSRVEIRTTVPPDLWLDSYPGPLGQVLGNLITNAVLHGYEGRAEGVLAISASLYDIAHVEIIVRDYGCGIPEENLQRVFDPFFTTRMGRGGTGLGLGICHNIVTETLAGTINVDSVVAAGTTVTTRIPLTTPDTRAIPPLS